MSAILENLKKSGHLEQISMTICNVGSRKISSQDDYASQGWDIFAPNLTIYGFDADADACDAANEDIEQRQINWTEKHIPLALANTVGEATLYVTKNPMCCSLYPPNESFINRFAGLSDLVNLDFTVEIETTTLDTFCEAEEIQEIDFLQLDIQGAELSVLEGANKILARSILAIQVEVNFSELYINEPLFGDVDKYLRIQGFTLFDLSAARRVRKDSPIQSINSPGQLLWGDALYFRDLIREDLDSPLKNPQNILKLAAIADLMNFPDYTVELLLYLTLEYGKNDPNYNFANNIIEIVRQIPELKAQGLASLPIVAKLRDYLTDYNMDDF
jgi:FkbM family methyltransferase